MKNEPIIRRCKKCNCELMSDNKSKLCKNCKGERFSKIIKIGSTVGGVAITAVTTVFSVVTHRR